MGLRCLLLESFSYDRGLPMAAAVTAATTVEAATAANCATATNRATATNCAAVETAADRYMRSAVEPSGNRAASNVAVSVPAITAVPAVAAAITRSSPIAGTSVVASVEPGTGSDEDATGEVARAVVTVRRASVWVVAVVSVRADRSWADVPRADADADCDSLSVSVRCQSQRGSKHCKNH